MARLVFVVIGLFLINISSCVYGMPVEDTEAVKKGATDPENYKDDKSAPSAMMATTLSPIRPRRQIFVLSTPNPITINPQLWVNNVLKNITGMMKRDVTSTASPIEIPQKTALGTTTTKPLPGKVVRRAAFYLPWTPSPTQDVYDNYLGKVRRDVSNGSSSTTKLPMMKS